MKKAIKAILVVFLILFIIVSTLFIAFFYQTKDVKLDLNKFINFDNKIEVYDCNNSLLFTESNGKSITDGNLIQDHTKNAFIAIEDKRFYSHNGIDKKAILRALVGNIKAFSFKEGASTITQQLIKNTHLTNEKTIKRKLIELKLAKQLERQYSKDKILETYLNTIYFGDNCYGITSASKHYFNKEPKELDLNESATLAGIIKSPSNYSPYKKYDNCKKRKDLVLRQMKEQKLITQKQFDQFYQKDVVLSNYSNNNTLLKFIIEEYSEIIQYSPYTLKNIKIYTSINKNLQESLENTFLNQNDYLNTSVLLDKNSQIKAYYSNCANTPRQLGSVIKPIGIYAPAIEKDVINSATPILDEKTSFDGYSPSNYNDNYLGYVSAKKSLAISSNVCAVKILNYLGVDSAVEYLKKMNIETTEKDKSLCLALGCTEKGAKLTDIASSYSVFLNDGEYITPTIINKIISGNSVIFTQKSLKRKVFSSDTISIMNDMMKETVLNGTAKKLSSTNLSLYAKTGTVGNKNGNSDAYCISYDKNYILGTRISCDKQLLDNNITGGGLPSTLSAKIWDKIYKNKNSPNYIEENDVLELYVDKVTYDEEHKIVLADENTPLRYKFKALFKIKNPPKETSNRFTKPFIENCKLSVNNNMISICLCLPQYYDALIFREENGHKKLVYNTLDNDRYFFKDYNLNPTKEYVYSVIPYYKNQSNQTIYGEEFFFKKIKLLQLGDIWKNGLG